MLVLGTQILWWGLSLFIIADTISKFQESTFPPTMLGDEYEKRFDSSVCEHDLNIVSSILYLGKLTGFL